MIQRVMECLDRGVTIGCIISMIDKKESAPNIVRLRELLSQNPALRDHEGLRVAMVDPAQHRGARRGHDFLSRCHAVLYRRLGPQDTDMLFYRIHHMQCAPTSFGSEAATDSERKDYDAWVKTFVEWRPIRQVFPSG